MVVVGLTDVGAMGREKGRTWSRELPFIDKTSRSSAERIGGAQPAFPGGDPP
jgi:hypothetical protein